MSEWTLHDLDQEELRTFIAELSEPSFRARQIWHAAYKGLVLSYDEITTLSKPLRALLSERLPLDPLVVVDSIKSRDGRTEKCLFRLADSETMEAVLMLYDKRRTVCVSTQVGCAIGCTFCATGKSGFTRDLTAGEIVAQVIHFARVLAARGERVTNVVYMGMGEPFLNYEQTMKSIHILNDQEGFGLGARSFTVSTVGIIPGIERFTRENLQVNLAISLHAGDDDLRTRLVPVNARYPLDALIRACREYTEHTHRRVTFEVALIDGVNDDIQAARTLAQLLSGLLCHVNLIPLNPVSNSHLSASPRERVDAFAQELRQAGINTTVRMGRGIKIRAGCGQLRSRTERERDQSANSPR